MTNHQTTSCPTEASISDQRHSLDQSCADDSACDSQHLTHPWSSSRTFVANHHHIASIDLAMRHRAHSVLLAVEDSCRSPVIEPLVPGDLDYTPFRRNVSFEDDQASIWLDWVRKRTYHILALRLNRHTRFIVDGKRNASFASHCQQVQHCIGRTTRCSHSSDGILKSLACQNISRSHSSL